MKDTLAKRHHLVSDSVKVRASNQPRKRSTEHVLDSQSDKIGTDTESDVTEDLVEDQLRLRTKNIVFARLTLSIQSAVGKVFPVFP